MKQEKFLGALRGTSDQKINLYVTGGGQNSAFTAGMLAAIADEGWTDRFHRYIGQSSGSFSVMYLLGGATHEGAAGYWRALPNAFRSKRFINIWRLFNPFRPIMDLNYMVDEFFDAEPCALPWERVLEHPANREGRFLIQVLDARTGKSLFLSRFTTTRALRAAIKASSSIPLLAGMRPFHLRRDLLAEMLVTDPEGNVFNTDKLYTYDGQIANSFFGDTYRAQPEELHLVLTNIARERRGQLANPFGPRLHGVEKLLSWILFWWCIRALLAYQKGVIDGGMWRDFDMLDAETLDEHTNVIGVFPTKSVSIGQFALEEGNMRQAVFAGFDGLYAALGLRTKEALWQNE